MQNSSPRARALVVGLLAALGAALALPACGGEGEGEPDGPSGPTMLNGEKYTATWGPLTVQPGSEDTQCAVLELGNDKPLKIHEMRAVLGNASSHQGSHHLIIYRDDVSAPHGPQPCKPFAGALTPSAASSPIMITQQHSETLTLPDGVAYSFAPNQKIRLEMHFLNATDQPLAITANATFFAAYPEQVRDEADFLFIGNPDISIGPGASPTFTSYFTMPRSLDGAQFYAITGHTHQLGTSVEISLAESATSPLTSIYAPKPFSWSEPETRRHEPAFQVPAGGGFNFSCSYRNPTGRTVKFGEATDDEMCFFWAYYYPSKGSRVCVHTTRVNAPEGIDVCCPADAGDTLSEVICAYLATVVAAE